MQRVAPAALFCLLLAACGSGGNGAVVEKSPDGRTLIETEIGPDGAKVIEFTILSGASGTLPAGMLPPDAAAEYARIASQVKSGEVGYYRYVAPASSTAATTAQALPDVAGVPQKVETKVEGSRVTETYTYGTPPAEKTAGTGKTRKSGGLLVADTTGSAPAAATEPAPTLQGTAGLCAPGVGILQGGTNYCIGK